jgi:outer membrane protein
MKNAPIVLSSLSLLGVIVLFALRFNTPSTTDTRKAVTTTGTSAGPATGPRFAWVNVDTFQENFPYLKEKREAFERRQEAVKAELAGSARKMQADYAAFQEKAQKGTLTEAEGQAAQQRLAQMDQSLQAREQVLTNELVKAQEEFQNDLRKKLDAFFEEYAKENNIDYVLSYTPGSGVMWASKGGDITADVIRGMNEKMKAAGSAKEERK